MEEGKIYSQVIYIVVTLLSSTIVTRPYTNETYKT